jgi:hypothetical protein
MDTRTIFRCRGVRGGTRRMFHVPGRETLSESSWPLETLWYKAEPKSRAVRQGVRGVHSTVWIARET